MRHHIERAKEKLRDWLARHARSRYALFLLGALSFFDAIIPPAPPDVLLIPMILANRKRWLFLATFAVTFSMIGGFTAYLIGAGLFDVVGQKIINFYGMQEKFALLGNVYATHGFVTIFGAAFTPIPDTVFTIGAGAFKLKIWMFALAYLLGRALRIYPEAFLVYLYGPAVARVVYKYFNIISLAFIAVVILLLVLL